LKDIYAQSKESHAITKYYVKALSLYDQTELNIDHKQAFENLTLAEDLNQKILVGLFKDKKLTIKLQLVKMVEFA